MKIALVGGHLAPALSVMEALKPREEVIFIGRHTVFEGDKAKSLEYEMVKEIGVPFIALNSGRVQRRLTRHTFTSLARIPYGFIQAIAILRKHKPDIVLSFGGYLSVPVGFAAFFLKIPLIIHEQTLEAGLANKILAKIAIKICISWKQSLRFFPNEKVVLTGNPIRKLSRSDRDPEWKLLSGQKSNENLPLLYITGGSSGAHALNTLVEACLENLLIKYRVIHQTGDNLKYSDFGRLTTLISTFPKNLQKRYYIRKFINSYDTGGIMKDSNLVISRSGINTVTELFSFGKPCFLIPLPGGQRNEQLKNAQFVKKVGIGEYVSEDELSPHLFLSKIEDMFVRYSAYVSHAQDAKSLITINATENIISLLYEVFSKKK